MKGERASEPSQPQQKGVVKRVEAVALEAVAAGSGTRMQVLLGSADGAPHFALRRFVMDAGGGMPLHRNRVEHEQYVLSGRARVQIGSKVYEVSAGSVLLIPAGVEHRYDVIEGPFEFLCIVPNQPDSIELLSGC